MQTEGCFSLTLRRAEFPEGTVLDISGESFVQTLAEKTLPHLVLLQIASGSSAFL
jgi:hypothetical protein